MLHEPPCFWNPLDATADFILGCWSLLTLDGSGLKVGCRRSGLGMGFLDTRSGPVNAYLYFVTPALILHMAFLGLPLISRPRLTSPLLAIRTRRVQSWSHSWLDIPSLSSRESSQAWVPNPHPSWGFAPNVQVGRMLIPFLRE